MPEFYRCNRRVAPKSDMSELARTLREDYAQNMSDASVTSVVRPRGRGGAV